MRLRRHPPRRTRHPGAYADAARTARLGTRTRDPAPLGGPSEKPDAGHTTDCVIPARRATRRVQRHALGRVARLICKVIRVEQGIVNPLVSGL